MKKLDQIIKFLKEKETRKIIQHMEGEKTTYLLYMFNDFWLETYKKDELIAVECVDEGTARFSLTARY